MAENVLTPEFRVSFPNLFKARKANEQAEAKYSVSMLFPKNADLSALKKAAEAAVKEKWGDKIPKKLKKPFLDQGDYDLEGYEPGCVLIRASSQHKPGVVDKNVQAIVDESEIYPGCYARATVRAFTYDVNGNAGVSFGLQNFQKLRDGEPIGGRTKPEDDFSPVAEGDAEGSSDSLWD
ncbi:MAG: DUF2815 family protein [Magnetococcus sp. YQC-9]